MTHSSLLFVGLTLSLLASSRATHAAESTWVHEGPGGKLVYQATPAGDRIMDFSHAGYGGGGVSLPNVPVKVTVKPSGGSDDTAAIQRAIDEVGNLPLENGRRGAVLLAPGEFTCASSLFLAKSGVVLRGSGSGQTGTTIKMVGSRHVAIILGDRAGPQGRAEDGDEGISKASPAGGRAVKTVVTDGYVPSGATQFSVAETAGFAVGDLIAVQRPTTAAWVELMKMHDLVRDGKKQTWLGVGRAGSMQRRITAIMGKLVTIDVPLADSLDGHYLNPPGTIIAQLPPGARPTQLGIEQLHLQCPPLEVAYTQAPYGAIRVAGDDCWVRDVYCEETMNATVLLGNRITLQQVKVTHTFANLGASKPSDFSIEGSQILIDRCEVEGDNEYPVWTSSMKPGPNVVLNSTFRGRGNHVQPHHRWSTGLLVDNCTVPDGGIDFMNRGVAGSGHGWTMGWAVAWNCVASTYVIQNPPGTMNWAIGNTGKRLQMARLFDSKPVLADGTYDSHGSPVQPQSLYLAQLAERLGAKAVQAIGYASNTLGMFPNKAVPRLPALPVERDPELGLDLAAHRPVDTSSVRGAMREFGGEKALDAAPATYWASAAGQLPARLELDVEGPLEINAVVLEEAAGRAGQVKAFKIEGQVDSDWKLLGEGTTIGEHQVLRFPVTTVWKVRVTVTKAEPDVSLRKVGIYLAR